MSNQLLSERDLARIMQVSPITVRRWRALRTGPEFVRCTRRVIRYEQESVNRWLMARKSGRAA